MMLALCPHISTNKRKVFANRTMNKMYCACIASIFCALSDWYGGKIVYTPLSLPSSRRYPFLSLSFSSSLPICLSQALSLSLPCLTHSLLPLSLAHSLSLSLSLSLSHVTSFSLPASQALGTPARIYYKYEGVSPTGSHRPNTAVPQVQVHSLFRRHLLPSCFFVRPCI